MGSPTVSYSGYDIMITWSAPSNGGETITAYEVAIYIPSTSTFVSDSNCDGSNIAIMYCTLDMNYLVSTYGFAYGDLLQARVRAENTNGFSEYSDVNIAGATILTKPTYMNAPTDGAGTDSTTIQVDFD